MSPRVSWSILQHELRVMLTDPGTVIFTILMPLLLVALTKELFAGALLGQGFSGANGSEFAVPGMAVAFASFGVGYAGFTFFRDHGWGTWDRLRASAATSFEILAGKITPTVLVTFSQLGLLFLLGGPLFGFEVTGSVPGLVVLIVVLSLALSAFGMLVTALARTMNQLNAIGSIGGVAMAMFGGAWVPHDLMPGWAQAISPFLPTYWAMEGFEDVILQSGGLEDVIVPSLVMIGFGLLFTVLAAWRFRFDEARVYYG